MRSLSILLFALLSEALPIHNKEDSSEVVSSPVQWESEGEVQITYTDWLECAKLFNNNSVEDTSFYEDSTEKQTELNENVECNQHQLKHEKRKSDIAQIEMEKPQCTSADEVDGVLDPNCDFFDSIEAWFLPTTRNRVDTVIREAKSSSRRQFPLLDIYNLNRARKSSGKSRRKKT